MTKLNWRNPKDYEYTDKLSTKGWAWEFIRRSDEYRKTYDKVKAAPKKRTPYPPKKANESPRSWMMRAEAIEYLTPSEFFARKWRLCLMYDPDMRYNEKQHHFKTHSSFPVFYGEPPGLEEIEDKDQKNKATKRFKEAPTLLTALRLLSDIGQPSGDAGEADTIFIGFDASMPLSDQIKKANSFLISYQKIYHTLGRKRPDVWTKYLRALDAKAAGEKSLTQLEIMKAIDKKKCANMDYNEVNDYASETLKAAIKMTTTGYKKLFPSLFSEK